MFYSHTFSFLLLIFANAGCSESLATEAIYRPADCAEVVNLVPKIAKSNPGEINKKTKGVPAKAEKPTITKTPPKPNPDEKSKDENDKVNVNDATSAQLETLPGIGPALAKRILDYRAKRKFKRLRDIRRVKGIGQAKFKKLKEKIRIK